MKKTILFPILLALGISAAHAAEGPTDPTPAAFEALYRFVVAAADDGRLPADSRAAADGIRASFLKTVIRFDAEIEAHKRAARTSDGAAREAALDALVRTAAARERILLALLHRLEATAGASATVTVEPEGPRKGRIRIEFAPEDIIETPQWVD